MKKFRLIAFLILLCTAYACVMEREGMHIVYKQEPLIFFPADNGSPVLRVPVSEKGNAEAGYKYLTEGNAFSSGIPLEIYKILHGLKASKLAMMAGYNGFSVNDFVVFENNKGKKIATAGCLQCHAQQFNDHYVIGLGNSYSNFQVNQVPVITLVKEAVKFFYGKNSEEWKNAERTFRAMRLLGKRIQTEMQGPTPAQKIAEVMASHYDPVTLQFRADTQYFHVPEKVIPEDPPALWISKKKNAFNINGMRQGNIIKHMVSNSLLTLNDTAEAKIIYDHTIDVWAYIKTLQPPRYPLSINTITAEKGKRLFSQNCARCHGTYGEKETYSCKIIPPEIIGTDSLLWKYFISNTGYINWYNQSWFATSEPRSSLKPQRGYFAPPLDGVWITAPYFHNGSIPTLENVLNSGTRPRYWKRNFNREEYNYAIPGWHYKILSRPGGKQTYNTDIPGYGNYGHTFGDHFSDVERKAVIEYLKTL